MSMLHHGIASLTQKFVTHICFDDEILTLPQIFFFSKSFCLSCNIIYTSQASTSTITDESDNTNPNLLTTRPTRTRNADALVIKPNSLREKAAQYNSHKDFLSRCT